MGRVHLEALRRVEFVDVAAIAGRELAAAKRLGVGFGVEAAVDDYRTLLKDRTIDGVHICTPNVTHYQMAKDALLAGKHGLCEKPLSVSVEEAQELVNLARERGLRNCVCHNLRYYPMAQQMRRMREDGELGEVLVVQGTYSQDWLLYETDWNWRIDARAGGPLR
jgi:predicted dehydrogenase